VPAITSLVVSVAVPDKTRIAEFSKSNLIALLRFAAGVLVPAAALLNSSIPDTGKTSTFVITIYNRVLYQYSTVK
jgi:hypothetical protein